MNKRNFLIWLDNEFKKYPMLAASPIKSMNELCYVLRNSGFDFSINWSVPNGFASIPSVQECFIPSRDLMHKIKIEDYEELEGVGCITVKIIYAKWHTLRLLKYRKEVECTRCNTAFEFYNNDPLRLDMMPYCPACGAPMEVDNKVSPKF